MNSTKSPKRAELRVDAVVVRHVVAVVAVGRRIERLEPEAGDAEPGEVVQPARQAVEVADAVAVAVDVLLDVEAVDDGVLVPEVVDHDGLESKTRSLMSPAAAPDFAKLCRRVK